MPTFAEHKKARFDYDILETLEAGLVLSGQEVKSIKHGRASLLGAFVTIRGDELFVTNMNVPPWQIKNVSGEYNETRPRKLLLHRAEIAACIGKIKTHGLTVLPLRLYGEQGKIKVELGVAKYRKKHDKRELIKKRDVRRELDRTLRARD